MKKNIVFVLFIAFITSTTLLFSQEVERQNRHQERKREIEAKKVAFISERLSLTPEEAQVFWPVYNEFNQKREELMRSNRRQRHAEPLNYDNLSDEEIEGLLDEEISKSQAMYALRLEFHQKLKDILPLRKAALFYEAEREFKKVLFDEARNERRERRRK